MSEITVYEFQHGAGVRVVCGKHAISAESGVPTAIRAYSSMSQAYAAEKGRIRNLLAMMLYRSL